MSEFGELNLLVHSTYNVEQIIKNKEFFNLLIDKIKSTYKVFNYYEYSNRNEKRVCMSPLKGHIENVFITMKVDGEIDFIFNISRKNSTLETIIDNYKVYKYTHHTELKIQGVNAENYQQYLPYIVKAIEFADYSFL
jgi:hypothetical protein